MIIGVGRGQSEFPLHFTTKALTHLTDRGMDDITIVAHFAVGKSAEQGDKDLFITDARNTDRLTRNLVQEIDSMILRVDQEKIPNTTIVLKLENTKSELQVIITYPNFIVKFPGTITQRHIGGKGAFDCTYRA